MKSLVIANYYIGVVRFLATGLLDPNAYHYLTVAYTTAKCQNRAKTC